MAALQGGSRCFIYFLAQEKIATDICRGLLILSVIINLVNTFGILESPYT